MPPIHYLNPPPNPFWDFVAGIEDHPFFAAFDAPPRHGFRPHGPPPGPPPQPQQYQSESAKTQPESSLSEEAKEKQAEAEDPPEIDPSTVKPAATEANSKETPQEFRGMPFRGRGRFARAFEEGENRPEDQDAGHRPHPCRGRGGFGRGHAPPRGPPGFMFGPPWFARAAGPGPHHHHPPPPPPPGHGGPHPPPHHHDPRHSGPPGRHGPGRRHGASPHGRHGPQGFDLGQFLNTLGDRLGVDLGNAAEGLGLDRFSSTRSGEDTNFEPRADIFDNKEQYTVHLSLPGAKKEDVGIDYNGETSVIHISGVVHRPGVDEEMLKQLVVDGRKRETGVFEKTIRLGTKRSPASIDVAGITAKMADGVLVVKIPKVEVVHQKRDIPISSSHSPSPSADDTDGITMFDADQEKSHHPSESEKDQKVPAARNLNIMDEEIKESQQCTSSDKGRQISKQEEEEAEAADAGTSTEQLPTYHEADDYLHDGGAAESDWEKYSDDNEDEGDFVKINVD